MIAEKWRTYVAMVIVTAYAYQLIVWPMFFWLMTLATTFTGIQWPAPPVVPWEHLLAATATLAAIGGIDVARDTLVEPDARKSAMRL